MANLHYSQDNPCPFRTLYVDDVEHIAHDKAFVLNNSGYPTDYIDSLNDLNRLLHGEISLPEYDILFVHKDFADEGAEILLRYAANNASHVRQTVVSGEYDDGVKRVFKMKPDAYCSRFDVGFEESSFLFQQIERGPVSFAEIKKRGTELLTPDGLLILGYERIERRRYP